MPAYNNAKQKMAAQGYSDVSTLLTTFNLVDRYAGDITIAIGTVTSLGRTRCASLDKT